MVHERKTVKGDLKFKNQYKFSKGGRGLLWNSNFKKILQARVCLQFVYVSMLVSYPHTHREKKKKNSQIDYSTN